MNIKELSEKADELYNLELIKFKAKESINSRENLLKIIEYYTKCIEKKPSESYFYYKRGLTYKILGKDFLYYFDIFICNYRQYNDGIKLFNSEKFHKKFIKFKNQDYTLIYELTFDDNIKSFSSSIKDSSDYTVEKVSYKISNESNSIEFINTNIEEDNFISYKNLFFLLSDRLELCKYVVCNNFIENRDIILSELNNYDLTKINEKKYFSVMKMVKNKFNIQNEILSNEESYNIVFSKNLPKILDSKIKLILTSDCYYFLKHNIL